MSKEYEKLISQLEKTQNGAEIDEIIQNLSQINGNFVQKIVLQSTIDLIKAKCNYENFEIAQSLNIKNCVSENTRVVVVGTITPWNGTNLGYFYTSNKNKVYGIIDKYFNNSSSSLVFLKKELSKEVDDTKKEQIIEKIKTILRCHQIAFLDVLRESVRLKQNSRDDKILLYSLDYDAFKNLEHIEKFICTSKNTRDCLEIIFDKLNLDKTKIVVCNQGWPQYRWEVWKTELDKIYSSTKTLNF